MKKPDDLEEFLAWPPLGGGVVVIVILTVLESLKAFHETIVLIDAGGVIGGYLFPVAMGVALAWRIEGKYWLGFSWLAFLVYGAALLVRLAPLSGMVGQIYAVLICCALMMVVQASLLYLKRFGFKT